MRGVLGVLAAVIIGLGVPALAANPDVGGVPVYTEDDYFSADDWGMTVYSYVFNNSSASLPAIYPGFTLNAGETLFMYLLDGDAATTCSVDHFAVGNPELIAIPMVGWSTEVVPAGYNVGDHQDPYLYGFSGPAEAVIYTYTGNFMDPWSTLDPGEYSLLYYVAATEDYGSVSATADGGGIGDNQLVPGPVPEPTTICLLALGSLALLRKRKK